MPVQVQVHSTVKRAVFIVGFAILLVGLLIGLKRLSAKPEDAASSTHEISRTELATYIAPVIPLHLNPQEKETAWSAALARKLNGSTEYPVQNGRVDVLTEQYAIEVERLEKWHEGIGQSSHYGLETGKVPCLAIIILPSEIPLSNLNAEKLSLIERTALKSGIKLLLLVASAEET